MRDAKTLYQALVLEHGKTPRNEGVLADATHEATLKNPLCGDRVTIQARVEAGVVTAAKFQARGCMIAKASASLLTETVIGRPLEACMALVIALDGLVVGDAAPVDPALESLRGVQ